MALVTQQLTVNTTEAASALPSASFFTFSPYDSENGGPAVWPLDIGLGVVYVLCLLQALLGNGLILFLLIRYKPYIRLK